MASTSQPIALRPSSASSPDYHMQDPSSFSASSSGPFNPASYTRQFIGSPISWRNGSFGMSGISSNPVSSSWGSRFPIGSPTHRLLSSFESGSVDGDRESIQNALNIFDREGEFCRNYQCCNHQLDDLHALLEHFEEVHIMVLDRDPQNPQAMIGVPFNPRVVEITPQQQRQQQERKRQQHVFAQQKQQQLPSRTPFDHDEMELELDLDTSAPQPLLPPAPPPSAAQSASSHSSPSSGAPSPPDTPISTPLSAYPSPHAFVPSHLPTSHFSPYVSQPSSPGSGTATSTRQSSPTGTSSLRPNLNVNLAYHQRSHLSSPSILAHPEDAFNPYARFASDYSSCLPGAQYNGASVDEASALSWQQVQAIQQQQAQQQQPQGQNGCLPPALLFAPSVSCTPAGTPGGSRAPSPVLHSSQINANTSPPTTSSPLNRSHTPGSTSPQRHSAPNSANASSASSSHSNPSAPANILRPAASLLLSKPFRCPKPNCNKSYKQANGLKYHMTHGSCNFAPPKDLEHVKDLLERKRREREAQGLTNGQPLNRSLSVGSNGSGALPPTLDTALLSNYYDLNLQSMNITETELREVEREAEKRLRPFACGVGDCQRRYKNMNGLRYHYQHSGEHGAVGLALLASGQHECLQNNQSAKRREAQAQQQAQQQANQTAGYAFSTEDEREGRKRFATTAFARQGVVGGSASMPVSRAGSTSRTRTPVPISVPVSANNSPKGSSASVFPNNNTSHPPAPPVHVMPMGSGTSSLSNALGMTSAMTTPIQVVSAGSSSRSSSGSPPQAQAQLAQGGSPPPQLQPTAQQMQQMVAAAAYQQYYQRQYAMQLHAAQVASQGVSGGASPPQVQQPGSPQYQSAYPGQQQQQQEWMAGMAMDMS